MDVGDCSPCIFDGFIHSLKVTLDEEHLSHSQGLLEAREHSLSDEFPIIISERLCTFCRKLIGQFASSVCQVKETMFDDINIHEHLR